MKILILLALITLANTEIIKPDQKVTLSAYGFITKYAIPLGNRIRAYEDNHEGRITGGSPSILGQFPYQAGVIVKVDGNGGVGVCGGSLVSPNRVVFAAHCWYDGVVQGSQATVVLGSVILFYGGTRINSTNIVMHPKWNYTTSRNDVAVIYLPSSVDYSENISAISLPSGDQLSMTYVDKIAVASGYGITSINGISGYFPVLSYVSLTVITNDVCSQDFSNVYETNLCTSGANNAGICIGDSGGPLAYTNDNNQTFLIGISSLVSNHSCGSDYPAVYSRVSSYVEFFNQHI